MPLYDITYPKARLISPPKLAKSEVIRTLKRKLAPEVFDKLVLIVDTGISSLHKDEKLIWTKTGALLGHAKDQPGSAINYFWEQIMLAVGGGKECLWAAGMMLRWRLSLREDLWLGYSRESSGIDHETGEPVTINEYWVNENFHPN